MQKQWKANWKLCIISERNESNTTLRFKINIIQSHKNTSKIKMQNGANIGSKKVLRVALVRLGSFFFNSLFQFLWI